MLFEGKVAIVTGAASGIGFGTSKRFLQEGAKVAICDVRQESVDAAVEQLGEYGTVCGFANDITNRAGCDEFVKKVVDRFGKVDILINNAGITKDAQFYKMADDAFRKVIEEIGRAHV